MQAAKRVDPQQLRDMLGYYPTGVAVVTGLATGGNPVGMVVGTFTSVSLEPPLIAFLPRIDSQSFASLRRCESFCVNVLASDQEAVCRQLAVTGKDKFGELPWSPAPGGAPVLDGVVCWMECDWDNVLPAGDHYIVLGRVTNLEVQRSSLPLLFFQGDYGRFSLPSLTTADPHLIDAAMLAERIRGHVEHCSAELGVECAVLAKLGDDVVTVLSASGTRLGGHPAIGERVPHIAPVGSVFLRDADEQEVQRWMHHAAGSSETVLGRLDRNVRRVNEVGYSLTLYSDVVNQRRELTTEYSSRDAMPVHARRLRELIASSVDRYDPVLEPGRRYDLESIAIPVRTPSDMPRLAVRILDLPPRAELAKVHSWIEVLSGTAASATQRLSGS